MALGRYNMTIALDRTNVLAVKNNISGKWVRYEECASAILELEKARDEALRRIEQTMRVLTNDPIALDSPDEDNGGS